MKQSSKLLFHKITSPGILRTFPWLFLGGWAATQIYKDYLYGASISFHSFCPIKAPETLSIESPFQSISSRPHNECILNASVAHEAVKLSWFLKIIPGEFLPSLLFPRIFPTACLCVISATCPAISEEFSKNELFILRIYSPKPL